MEVAHVSGQDTIRGFADRLVEENLKLDQRLLDLKGTTETHLSTIEETFQRCSQAMEELKSASQAATSAAAHAMASSPGATASSTVTPVVGRTELALWRAQPGSVAAVQLVLDERVTSLDDRLVAQQVPTQSAVAEVTTLALGAATGVRDMDAVRVAAEAVLIARA